VLQASLWVSFPTFDAVIGNGCIPPFQEAGFSLYGGLTQNGAHHAFVRRRFTAGIGREPGYGSYCVSSGRHRDGYGVRIFSQDRDECDFTRDGLPVAPDR